MNSNRIFLMVFAILLGAIGSVSAGLVAQWDFTEGIGDTATDSVNSIVATLTDYDDPNLAWGISDTCKLSVPFVELDNVNDHLYVPYNALLDPGSGAFTVTFWFYMDTYEGGEIIHNGTSGGDYSGKRYAVILTSGQANFTIDDNGEAGEGETAVSKKFCQGWPSGVTMEGEWHLVVARRIAGVGMDLWVDGIQCGANAFSGGGDIVEEGEDLYIGQRGPDESRNSFGGKLADIRYYDYDISNAEIAALYVQFPIPWCPTPADGAANVSLTADLRWRAPVDANEAWTYDVYIADNENMIDPIHISGVPDGGDPNVPNSDFGPMTAGDYWWRVDSNDPNTASAEPVRTGDVWTFNAGVSLPELVNPPDGSGGYGLELTLQWLSDNTSGLIVEHRLVLNNVTDGTSNSVDLEESKDSYFLGNAALWDVVFYGKDYTWQIIELGAGDVVLAEGPLWSFSTLDLECPNFVGDLTGDCKVDLVDFSWIAATWLDCGWRVNWYADPIPYPEKDPCLW